MYPLTCLGGFSMPVRAGKMEIVGYSVAAETAATAIELQVVDDVQIKSDDKFGRLLTSFDSNKTELFHKKGIAVYGVQIDTMFPEPIKTRHGISIRTENVKAGSFCLYVR